MMFVLTAVLAGCGGSVHYATVSVPLEEPPQCLLLGSGVPIECPLVLLFPPRLQRAPGAGGYLLGP